jgi:hypothetical protein
MKSLKQRFLFLTGVIVFAAALSLSVFSKPAQAVLLSNTSVDALTLSGILGAPLVPLLSSPFDFAAPTVGGDGNVVSQVFTGIGGAAGLNVYLYQINHFAISTEVEVGGITIDFTGPLGSVGPITSFVIDSAPLPPPPAGFVAGSVSPTFADFTSNTLSWGPSPVVIPWIAPGASSFVFGVFSPKLPTTVVSDVIDGGSTILSATVYSVPEPMSLFILGFGLAALGLFGWRKNYSS